MASRKPVADSLADQIARAQARGRRAATDGSQGYGTRSRSAARAASSSEDEVFESPRGVEGAGAASLSAQQAAAAAYPFPRSTLIARTPPAAAAAPPVQRRRQAQSTVDFGATYRLDHPHPATLWNDLLQRPASRSSQTGSATKPRAPTPPSSSSSESQEEAAVESDGGNVSAGSVESQPALAAEPDPPAGELPQQPAPIVVPAAAPSPPPAPQQAAAVVHNPPHPSPSPPPAPVVAPPVVNIGHVLPPAGAGAAPIMAAPVLPAVPAAGADARRAVVRTQRYLARAVDRLADAVTDQEAVELVRNRRIAMTTSKKDFRKAMDDLSRIVDDPAVVANDGDRELLVTQLFDYSVAIEEPAEEREAEADQYVNEVETAAKARKNTKLPELTVVSFEGKVTEWPRFRAEFNSIVGSRADLPESSKLAYLVGSCKGEALRLVKQYRATNTPFASVMAALEARFGRPDLQLKQAFDAIAKLDPGQHSPTDTRRVLDELKPLLVTIRANNVDTEQPSFAAMLLAQLAPKIRGEVMTAWHRHCTAQGWVGPNLPTLNNFLLFADREVDALVSGQLSRGGGEKKKQQQQQSQGQKGKQLFPQRSPGTALVGAAEDDGAAGGGGGRRRRGKRGGGGGSDNNGGGSTGGASQGGTALAARGATAAAGGGGGGKSQGKVPGCAFCKSDNHRPENCPDGKKMTPRERRRCLRSGCWRCLEMGHMARECKKARKPCGVPGCDADHHRILHGDFEAKKD
jgi:hypothetical protein